MTPFAIIIIGSIIAYLGWMFLPFGKSQPTPPMERLEQTIETDMDWHDRINDL